MPDFDFDLFVSHGSEDKDSFVRPLVEALQAEHLSVWYDETELRPGARPRSRPPAVPWHRAVKDPTPVCRDDDVLDADARLRARRLSMSRAIASRETQLSRGSSSGTPTQDGLAAEAMRRVHDHGWVVVARGDLSGSVVCHAEAFFESMAAAVHSARAAGTVLELVAHDRHPARPARAMGRFAALAGFQARAGATSSPGSRRSASRRPDNAVPRARRSRRGPASDLDVRPVQSDL